MKQAKKKTFKTQIHPKFRDADPAGIMFFGNIFSFAHDAFEEFIEACGIGWNTWFIKPDFFVPIRYAECEYFAPFVPGQTYLVEMSVENISTSTFKMRYEFYQSNTKKGKLFKTTPKATPNAIVKTAHTFADKEKKIKKEIPPAIRKKLSAYVHRE